MDGQTHYTPTRGIAMQWDKGRVSAVLTPVKQCPHGPEKHYKFSGYSIHGRTGFEYFTRAAL